MTAAGVDVIFREVWRDLCPGEPLWPSEDPDLVSDSEPVELDHAQPSCSCAQRPTTTGPPTESVRSGWCPVNALSQAQLEAITRYPELQRLADLRAAGRWTFQPARLDEDVVLIAGWRLWPPDAWSDAIAIHDLTNAKAFRCDPAGGQVWKCEGTLVEVINGLLALPAPGQPGAPRLVVGSAPKWWTPGQP